MIKLINIGFLEFRFIDLLDILIVGYLFYLIYRLLKGSLAIYIFTGLALIYAISWLVSDQMLDMKLLSAIINQFISVGVIAFLILFQPEIRRFLLMVGRTTSAQQKNIFSKFMKKGTVRKDSKVIKQILLAFKHMSLSKTGALVIVKQENNLAKVIETGVEIEGKISAKLLESIFSKKSPLHDGGIIINSQQILVANCILPVSENLNLPSRVGLRHRAAVGLTEKTDAVVFVVSEENGTVSYARSGVLTLDINQEKLSTLLKAILAKAI